MSVAVKVNKNILGHIGWCLSDFGDQGDTFKASPHSLGCCTEYLNFSCLSFFTCEIGELYNPHLKVQ